MPRSSTSLAGTLGPTLAGVGGAIYALGGIKWTGSAWVAVPDVNRYDPAKDSWSSAAPMGTARYLAAATANGATLDVAGGSSSANHYALMPLDGVEAISSP